MISRTRRDFVIRAAGVCAAASVVTISNVRAAVVPIDENDPVAKGLGYKAKASTVDAAHFPRYQLGQSCANCSLYTGAAGSVSGTCPMFAGKTVAAAGWCNLYAKRA